MLKEKTKLVSICSDERIYRAMCEPTAHDDFPLPDEVANILRSIPNRIDWENNNNNTQKLLYSIIYESNLEIDEIYIALYRKANLNMNEYTKEQLEEDIKNQTLSNEYLNVISGLILENKQ